MLVTLHLGQGRGKAAPQVQGCVVLRAVFFPSGCTELFECFFCFVIIFCGLLSTKYKLNNWLSWYFFRRATWILKIRRKCRNFSVPLILYASEMIMNVRAMCTAFFLFFCLPQSISISLGWWVKSKAFYLVEIVLSKISTDTEPNLLTRVEIFVVWSK